MEKSRTTQRPLVIHVTGHDPCRFTWYWHGTDGQLQRGGGHQPLPTTTQGTVLLLPASQIVFHQITSRHITPQTLSWQLETLALSDPEKLHTLALAREGDQVHLAAVDRAWLRQVLSGLRDRGVDVTRALPDALVLDEGEALQVDERWLIRHQRWQGVSLDADRLALLQHDPLLMSALTAASADAPAAAAERLYQQACRQRITLLQGEFAVRLPLHHARAFTLACALCSTLMLLIPPLWSGWQASTRAHQAQQQSLALYQRYFPQETPAHPAARLAKQLQALAAGPTGDGPLQLLADSAALLATLQDNPLQTLQWDQQQQRLHLRFARRLPVNGLGHSGLVIEVEDKMMMIGRKS